MSEWKCIYRFGTLALSCAHPPAEQGIHIWKSEWEKWLEMVYHSNYQSAFQSILFVTTQMDHNSIFLLAFWNAQSQKLNRKEMANTPLPPAAAAVAAITQYLLVSLALPQRISYHCDKRKEHLSSLTIYEMRLLLLLLLLPRNSNWKWKCKPKKMREFQRHSH